MEHLIDKNYFWGGLYIPDLSEARDAAELDRYIAKYQKEYIKRMFGVEYANLDELPDELVAELMDETMLVSPIANFVYFYYQRDKATVSTASGEKQVSIQSTASVSPNEKLVRAWNEMVEMSAEIHRKLYAGEITLAGVDYLEDIYANIKPTDDIFCFINPYNV